MGLGKHHQAAKWVITLCVASALLFNPLHLVEGAPAIVDGQNTQNGRYPYNVRIINTHDGGQYVCSGSLVAATFVLTAGHCVFDHSNALLSPSAFALTIGQDSQSTGNGVTRGVVKVMPHPRYNSANTNLGGFDIAILQLDQAVSAPTPKLNTVSPTAQQDGMALTALGWGLSSQTPLAFPDHLQSATLFFRYTAKQYQSYPDNSLPVSSTSNAVPRGTLTPATCGGDSGGPIIAQGSTPADDVLYGTDSYGASSCGTSEQASVYMDIGQPDMASFILSVICPVTCPIGAAAGNYTICPSGTQTPLQVYCTADGKAYLNLDTAGGTINYSLYGAGPNTNGGTPRTQFAKVRLNTTSLAIIPDDFTFATTNNVQYCFGPGCGTFVPYGNAGDCANYNSRLGRANMNLTGTDLVFVPDQFAASGFYPQGTATYSNNGQVVELQGGGYCGNMGPKSGTVRLVFGLVPEAAALSTQSAALPALGPSSVQSQQAAAPAPGTFYSIGSTSRALAPASVPASGPAKAPASGSAAH